MVGGEGVATLNGEGLSWHGGLFGVDVIVYALVAGLDGGGGWVEIEVCSVEGLLDKNGGGEDVELVRGRAQAGQAPYAQHPRFVCMTTQHGGVTGANMFPVDAVAGTAIPLYGYNGSWGALSEAT